MNSEPCVRLGIRISPKIREKPADSRNSRPPNVTLLTVSSTQKVIAAAPLSRFPSPRAKRGGEGLGVGGAFYLIDWSPLRARPPTRLASLATLPTARCA